MTSLLFTLPLSTLGRPGNPQARDWLGGGFIVAGLVLFLASRGAAHGADSAHRDRFLFILLVLLAAVIGLTVLAGLRTGPLRATLLACAAGASFAASASLVKLTSDDLVSRGVDGTATDWPGYALAVVSVFGVLLQQVAFASGRLPVAATAMIVVNPVVGTAIAIVAFAELLPDAPVRPAGPAFGAAPAVAGVAVPSHSPLLTDRAPPSRSGSLGRRRPSTQAQSAGGGDSCCWPSGDGCRHQTTVRSDGLCTCRCSCSLRRCQSRSFLDGNRSSHIGQFTALIAATSSWLGGVPSRVHLRRPGPPAGFLRLASGEVMTRHAGHGGGQLAIEMTILPRASPLANRRRPSVARSSGRTEVTSTARVPAAAWSASRAISAAVTLPVTLPPVRPAASSTSSSAAPSALATTPPVARAASGSVRAVYATRSMSASTPSGWAARTCSATGAAV